MPGHPDLIELLARDPAFVNAVAARSTRDAAAAALNAIRSNWRTFAPSLRPAATATPGAIPGGAPAAGAAAGGPFPGAAGLMRVGSRPLDRQASLLKARGPLKLKDFVRIMRRELAAAEEQVPWSLVDNRWRAQRKHWQRRVRQADSVQGLAGCIWELHGYLRTEKSAGLFAAGGPWERGLLAIVNGAGSQLQLQAAWDEMRGGLGAWLEQQQLPGSSASLDKASYAQAVRTFNVLQEAAARGPEYLDQVPLDAILTTQRELAALQAIIQREHGALHARLAAEAAAAGGDGAAAAAAAAALDAAVSPDGGLLATLGRLPGIRGAEDDDVDTDGDNGSEATDMEDSE